MKKHRKQDIILTVGQLLLLIAPILSIIGVEKPSIATSFISAAVLTIFAIVFYTLGLKYSPMITGLTSICWYVLGFQVV